MAVPTIFTSYSDTRFQRGLIIFFGETRHCSIVRDQNEITDWVINPVDRIVVQINFKSKTLLPNELVVVAFIHLVNCKTRCNNFFLGGGPLIQ